MDFDNQRIYYSNQALLTRQTDEDEDPFVDSEGEDGAEPTAEQRAASKAARDRLKSRSADNLPYGGRSTLASWAQPPPPQRNPDGSEMPPPLNDGSLANASKAMYNLQAIKRHFREFLRNYRLNADSTTSAASAGAGGEGGGGIGGGGGGVFFYREMLVQRVRATPPPPTLLFIAKERPLTHTQNLPLRVLPPPPPPPSSSICSPTSSAVATLV